MLARLYKIAAALLVVLGLVHCAFTPFSYAAFTLDAFWFLTAGFAIVFTGFLNLVLARHPAADALSRALVVIANVVVLLLFASVLFVLIAPQVFIGLALVLVCLAASLRAKPGQP